MTKALKRVPVSVKTIERRVRRRLEEDGLLLQKFRPYSIMVTKKNIRYATHHSPVLGKPDVVATYRDLKQLVDEFGLLQPHEKISE